MFSSAFSRKNTDFALHWKLASSQEATQAKVLPHLTEKFCFEEKPGFRVKAATKEKRLTSFFFEK
jgi:hypothetical protein